MKAMGRLLGDTSIVSLAGGMPHASLFPMSQATFTVPHPRTLGDVAGWTSGEGETLEVNLYKNRKGGAIDLAKGLQYGLSNGECTPSPLRAASAEPAPFGDDQ
jgi:hypothetical protein